MIWLHAFNRCVEEDIPSVLVTITRVKGSAPRAVGTRMLVTSDNTFDTLGGGALEFEVTRAARDILLEQSIVASVNSVEINLGPVLSQCCGGSVTVQYDYHPPRNFNIVVFGAGHVAQCIATILAGIPCTATFVDAREDCLGKIPSAAPGEAVLRVEKLEQDSFSAVQQFRAGSYFLVMTHSHELDFELVEAILTRNDSRYAGLIASKSKAARFRNRLRKKGFSDNELRQLTSPVGTGISTGNRPMEVAVAIVAELLEQNNARNGAQKAVISTADAMR